MSSPSEDRSAHLPDRFVVNDPELRKQVAERTPIRFRDDGEPYIPLPAPFERFYLGAMRRSDIPHDSAMMSDIRVARTLVGPPFPAPISGSQGWLVRERGFIVALFNDYTEGRFVPTEYSPFDVVREQKQDGSEVYVGQVTIGHMGPSFVRKTPVDPDWEEWRSHRVTSMGAALNADYHGKGIASAAVDVLLKQWAIPQMGCTEILAQCFLTNFGSYKLWQKFGFVEDESLRKKLTIEESKGGGEVDECVLIWKLS